MDKDRPTGFGDAHAAPKPRSHLGPASRHERRYEEFIAGAHLPRLPELSQINKFRLGRKRQD
ncbi:hypothetical protein QO001_006474 [Methylobacterium brachiatum]|uniref:Uncharacterized protein n=1 Tax=Methylobacterium brachiatum TaxID=269660 RepID=A0AAJ1X0N5_9HYPH|nr:hypothetical protein [Methylobacterium brachiatum]